MDLIDKLLQKKIDQFSGLETQLKQGSVQVKLSTAASRVLKNRVMKAVKSGKPADEGVFESLTNRIRILASQIHPSEYFKFMLGEKLAIFGERQERSRWAGAGIYRRTFASALVLFLVFGMFFNFGYNVDRADASVTTILEQISGSVVVVRGEQVLSVQPGFMLRADDVIQTGPGSRAIIRFMDQSVSRLDENTDVKISKLYVNPNNQTETIVEVIIEQGRMWSRVVNLVDDVSRFQVKAQNTVAVARKKAAFDVMVPEKGHATVAAIQNHVDLVLATDKKVVETTLVKGFSAELTATQSVTSKIVPDSNALTDTWVADNLEQDKQYIEEVKQQAQSKLKGQGSVRPDDPLYAVKLLTSNTEIALTFDEASKQSKILYAAKDKLSNAEVFLEKGDMVSAQNALNEFKGMVQGVVAWINANEATQSNNVAPVKAKLEEMLDSYQKSLSLLLPTDSLYSIKQTVADVKVLIATDSTQKTQEKLSQASDKLLELHDLIEQGDTVTATQQVQEYSKAISEVISEVRQLPTDEKEKAVAVILSTKTEDLKALEAATTAIAPVVTTQKDQLSVTSIIPENVESLVLKTITTSAPTAQELQKTITEVKAESLSKVGEAVLDVQSTQPSADVLKGLEFINNVDVNGKSIVDVQVSKDRVQIRTDGAYINVSQDTKPAVEATTTAPSTAATTTTTTTTTTSSGTVTTTQVSPSPATAPAPTTVPPTTTTTTTTTVPPPTTTPLPTTDSKTQVLPLKLP